MDRYPRYQTQVSSSVLTARLWRLAIIAGAIAALVWLGVRYVLVQLNPVLLINEDPSAKVFVDGNLIQFQHGTAILHPWKNSYVVEVRFSKGVEIRRILPWDPSSDSGAVSVSPTEVRFDFKNTNLK
ncbi:MAG: hypothetical protein HZC36_08625 [Armatimonadetes bacterium]|nr:hypothetical protein [Armatimonadota bacterium]